MSNTTKESLPVVIPQIRNGVHVLGGGPANPRCHSRTGGDEQGPNALSGGAGGPDAGAGGGGTVALAVPEVEITALLCKAKPRASHPPPCAPSTTTSIDEEHPSFAALSLALLGT